MRGRSYFVTGTDTGVGKTLVASALVHLHAARGVRAAGMKPVASGAFLDPDGQWCNDDVQALQAAANVALPPHLVNPFLLRQATAPHIAARAEGVHIELEHLAQCHAQLLALCDVLIVEGAGGFMVPLDERYHSDDLVARLDLPVVLVVGIRLGCINHALLTQQAIRWRGLRLAGWVANRIDAEEDQADAMIDTLVQRLQAPLLGRLPWSPGMTAAQAAARLTWPDPA
ncbi:dethiobiotin synthase [Herbaspirillum rubrisubalbicans Os34]|uniref:ATP-dependent dethiobiotin synthetase BioD n=1 Tax=Herbaspirillum rubrisubalbicans Os34 TaxID=1235827 RepID=A0A6M3ZRM2_9BURK|nr:dethiobiotin synthase [Herbaspirillum rubrisubalbicans]QJQ01011.1 dethiobiotin synthase [Herbaspirillum rubrisubalbicans Os34]